MGAQPDVQSDVVNDPERKANLKAETVVTENSELPLAIDSSGQADIADSKGGPETAYIEGGPQTTWRERGDGDDVLKADAEGELAAVESKLDDMGTEIVDVVKVTERREEQITASIEENHTKDNTSPPAQKSADPDPIDSDSDTEEDATPTGPPLLTIDGNHIRRHSDTAKKLYAQLANSNDLTKQIGRKDFVQYFRNQGASNLTCRRLYAKFNPKNSPFMDYDEFQSHVLTRTLKAGEEAKQ